MNHTDLLNYLITKHGLKSYCEIGVRDTRQNFDEIRCPFKIGVDPCFKRNPLTNSDYRYGRDELNKENIILCSMDSDTYFKESQRVMDLIFIDGDHTAEQVERDFNNSLRCLNDGGFIVIHDCLPTEEKTTCVPRGSQKIWHGTVYQFVMKLYTLHGIGFVTLNMDEGCCIVWKDKMKQSYFPEPLYPFGWRTYKSVGKVIMNVVEPEMYFNERVI